MQTASVCVCLLCTISHEYTFVLTLCSAPLRASSSAAHLSTTSSDTGSVSSVNMDDEADVFTVDDNEIQQLEEADLVSEEEPNFSPTVSCRSVTIAKLNPSLEYIAQIVLNYSVNFMIVYVHAICDYTGCEELSNNESTSMFESML